MSKPVVMTEGDAVRVDVVARLSTMIAFDDDRVKAGISPRTRVILMRAAVRKLGFILEGEKGG